MGQLTVVVNKRDLVVTHEPGTVSKRNAVIPAESGGNVQFHHLGETRSVRELPCPGLACCNLHPSRFGGAGNSFWNKMSLAIAGETILFPGRSWLYLRPYYFPAAVNGVAAQPDAGRRRSDATDEWGREPMRKASSSGVRKVTVGLDTCLPFPAVSLG